MTLVYLSVLSIIIIVGIAVFAANQITIVGQYSKNMKLIIGGYALILFIGGFLYFIGPNTKSASINEEQASLELAKLSDQMIKDIKQSGKLQIDVPFVRQYEWEFPITTDKVNYALEGSYNEMNILVERVEELEESIQVTYYQAGAKVNQLNVTERHRAPHIELVGGQLTVMDPAEYKIELSGLLKETIIKQFTGEMFESTNREQLNGVKVMHVKIPLDLEISFGYFPVEFIN
ncbi:hypothetical protein [Bacillus horti]|uniref:Type II secretory pathway component PulM n=1 Tax=Caldalkalibacillus horti TaxID=77523 RepID=A0ABT9VX29_9BACI|nr:hypothetical protein [Bacillus horti]MDQ0165547.1 type II secretory pathway component PulM [Bacillus horti]